MRKFTEYNLLTEWYKEALVISSALSLDTKFNRNDVLFIYNTLLSFFELSFFDIRPDSDKAINKISWIFSLLSNISYTGCFWALYDFCKLVDYSKKLPQKIQTELQSVKRDPLLLRTFMFELYIYSLLDQKKIENKKKILVGTQVVEGTFKVSSTEYLFECRKAFFPKLLELDINRRLMIDFVTNAKKINKGTGMICSIRFKRPIKTLHRDHFRLRIQEYFDYYNKIENFSGIDYYIEDELGEFKVVDFDEASLVEFKHLKKSDILFYVIPPKIPIHNQPNYYQIEVQSKFSVPQSKVYEKLESILKEKKKQHKNSPYTKKVIFLESEILPEFQMGLFQNDITFDLNEVEKLCKKLHIKDTICLIRKIYTTEKPQVLIDILSTDSSPLFKETLISLFK